MPDNLTLEFKRQLDERTKAVAPPEPPSPGLTTQTGGSLWETARGRETPDWMSQAIDDKESNMLTALGKGVWTAADITLLGVPGYAARKIDPEWAKSMEPQTFGERVAAGIGGAAGFLLPMTWARTAASAGIKAFAAAGTRKFAQSYADDAVKLMRGDKDFMKWVTKKVKRGDIQPFRDPVTGKESMELGISKFLESVIHAPKATLLSLGTKEGEAMFMRTAKNRMRFAKNFNKNTPEILMEKLKDVGYTGKNATNLVNTLGDDIAKKIGTVIDDAGATFKFPVTQLHSVLSGHMGNGKLGNLAAHAIEEAILFSAVELPLNYMNSLNNEEVDFNFAGTLGHAWMLGSALGLIRFIPGGSDYGILRPAWNRITKTLQTRRRYNAYDVSNEADRLFLGEEAKRLFDMKKEPLQRIRKIVKEYKGRSYKIPINKKTDLDEFVKTKEGAQSVKDVLMDIEKAMYKDWYPRFLKEIPGDLFGSGGRMLAGAMAFNFTGIKQMTQEGYPWEDIIFNVALGMFMTKKGKAFEYTNRDTGKIEHVFDERPYTFDSKLEDVDKWLNYTNTAVDSALYRMLYNEHVALRHGFGGPVDTTADMQKIKQIAESEDIIVKKYVEEDADGNRIAREQTPAKIKKKVTNEDGTETDTLVDQESTYSDELYTAFAYVVDKHLKPRDTEYEVLDAYELSPDKLQRIKEKLSDHEFEGLKEIGRHGISTAKDLEDVVLGSADAEAIRVRDIYQQSIIAVYNKVFAIINGDKDFAPFEQDMFQTDGRVDLQPLDWKHSKMELPNRDRSIFNPDSSFMKILGPHVRYDGNPIRLTQEMVDSIFGKYKGGELVEPGVLTEFDNMLTETILGEKANTIPQSRKFILGNDMVGSWVPLVLNRRSVRQHWKAISDLGSDSKNKNKIFEDREFDQIESLFPSIFQEEGSPLLPDIIEITGQGGKKLEYSDARKEYSFVNSLLGVIRNDFERSTGSDSTPITRKAKLSEVKKLFNIIDKRLPILTMQRGDAKNELVQMLSEYTLDRGLANFTKEGGIPLDSVDRSKIKFFVDQKMVTPRMTALNITGVIDNLTKMFEWFNDNKAQVERMDDLTQFIAILRSDPNQFYEIAKAIGDTKFLSEIAAAAEQTNMNPAEFVSNLLKNYNDHLLPYVKESGKVGGFITIDTTGAGEAHVSAGWLAELNLNLDMLNEGFRKITHDQFLNDILPQLRKGSYGFSNKTDLKIQKMLKNVVNLYLSRPSTAPLAIKALAKSGLYDMNKKFNFETLEESNVIEMIREFEDTSRLMFQILNNDRDLAVMWSKDRLDGESRYPVDKQVTMSLNKYLKKYNIELEGVDGVTLNTVLKDNVDAMKNIFNFYNFMKNSGASLTYKGERVKSNKWGLKQYSSKHDKFLEHTLMVYSQLRNSVTANKIVANGDRNPRYVQETFQKTEAYDIIKELIGEYTLVDTQFKKSDRSYNIALDSVDDGIKKEFFNIVASQPSIAKEGFGTSVDVMQDLSDAGAKTPYAIAFIGTQGDGIGVPLFLGHGKYESVNNIVREFVRIFDGKIKEMGDEMHPDAIRLYNDFRTRSLKSVERKVGEEADGTDITIKEWAYQEGDTNFQRVNEDLTMMLNNIVGHKIQGNEWWESYRGEKWNDGDEFAKKQLRYMKLSFNRSAKPITSDYINEVVDLLERSDDNNVRLFNFLGDGVVGDKDSVKSTLKRLSKQGYRAHLLGDESPLPGGDIPEISSLFKTLASEIKAEEDASFETFNDFDTVNLSMPGGNVDVSRFDSINIVSRDLLDAIKFLSGFHNTEVEHFKPVGSSASDRDSLFLDKTAFITDRAWDAYLENHKIDLVIMDSSAKMAGTGIVGAKDAATGKSEKIIYMDEFKSMSELMGSKKDDARFLNKSIQLPSDTFSIASVVKPQKSSTLPLQIANDLVGPELNMEFYDWMLDGGVRDFIKESNKIFADGSSSEIAGKLNIDFEELDVAMDQMSLLEKWIELGGDPTWIPFKRTVRNTIYRQLIRNNNLFTPRNKYGSQSVVVPVWGDLGTEGYLRNSKFKTTWRGDRSNNSEDIESREMWTYGQMEADVVNMGKEVVPERVRIIEHNNAAKDRLIKPKEVSNDLDKLLDGKKVVTLGELFRTLEGINEGLEGKRYEVAVVVHRTPTTRSSDKVIVGLKGFGDLTGNAARINHADGWFRLELDFDIDKINYWWDTPEKILDFWDSKSGEIPSVKGEQERSSIEGLNPLNGKQLVNYNFSEANSSLYRGIVVKARNTVQFLKHYQGRNFPELSGFNMNLDKGRIVLANEDQVRRVEERIAIDIQKVVDAQGRGYDKKIFNNKWEEKILFGDGSAEYPGLLKRQYFDPEKKKKEYITSTEPLDRMERDMVIVALRPYKRFLNLRTSVFESGEQKKVDYDTLLDYTRQYMYTMNNLDKYVYWTLNKGKGPSKQKWSKSNLDPIFKNQRGDFVDPFKLRNAMFDQAVKGEDAANQNFLMIASDRMVGNLAGWDRLTMKRMDRKVQDRVDNFIMDYLLGDTKDIAGATKIIINEYKSDFKKLDALNSIDYRMRRYRRSQRKMESVNNHDLAQSFRDSYNNLRNLHNSITSELMINKKVAKSVRSRIINQIRKNLASGGTWLDRNNKPHNFSNMKSRAERENAINKIGKEIAESVWDYKNQKLAVNIRGVNTDDYAQISATYNVLSRMTGVGLDPAYVGMENAMKFEGDIRDFRRTYGKKWWDSLNNKMTSDMDADSIMNESLIELEKLYYDWENKHTGLGRHLILSIMTPRISNETVTYVKGHLMPGFDKVHTQTKFITVGLRMLDRLDSSMSRGLMMQIAKPISNQLAWMRGEAQDVHFDGLDQMDYTSMTAEDIEGGSPLIGYKTASKMHEKLAKLATFVGDDFESLPMDQNELKEFEIINREVLNIFGMTGDLALDYIAFKLPDGGLDLIASLSALTELHRLPRNALTQSGKIVPVGGVNSYFRHKMNQVRMFFGGPRNSKNLFTGRETSVPGDIYGNPDYKSGTRNDMKSRTNRWVNEVGC